MREMEWRISENSSGRRFPWALMLKHSFQAFLLNFLLGKDNRDYWKFWVGLSLALIFSFFTISPPSNLRSHLFWGGDSLCPESSPVPLWAPEWVETPSVSWPVSTWWSALPFSRGLRRLAKNHPMWPLWLSRLVFSSSGFGACLPGAPPLTSGWPVLLP